jgi:PKD repeat protein
MRTLLLIVICSNIAFVKLSAQWLNANPGAGGQLQHLVCDPNISGRMYLCSDMEGYYVSDDFGDHWEYKGWESPFSSTFNIAVEPGNSNRLYLTSTQGIAISDDAGESWNVVNMFKSVSVATIAVNPKNVNQICFAESWLESVIGNESGAGRVFYSTDRGETWQISQFLSYTSNKNIYSINYFPTEEKEDMLVSTSDGIFITKDFISWEKITAPANAQFCRGCDFTPDGKWLYAVYIRKDGNTGLYVKKYDDGDWQELDPDGFLQSRNQTHWRPKVYPKSKYKTHHVLIGVLNTGGNYLDNALTEGRFLVEDGKVMGHVNRILKIQDDTEPFDVGWNAYWSHCRTYDYYPGNWEVEGIKRGVFAMSQQSTFRGDAAKPDDWVVNTCHVNHTKNGTKFYSTNGTASTWVWDIAGVENYVAMGMGDNGITESWDNGVSWTQKYAPALWNVDALGIVTGNKTIVLAGRTDGFGGALFEDKGWLYFREVDTQNPGWGWTEVINGKSGAALKGLNSGLNRIATIQSDPHKTERVYVGTNDALYVTENIFELIKDNPEYYFKDISKPVIGSTLTRRVHVDPNDPDILYLRCWKGTFRIEKQEDGSYNFVKLKVNGSDQNLNDGWGHNGDMSVWNSDTTTWLMVTRNVSPDWELWLSDDKGETFARLLNKEDAFAIRPPGAWFTNQKPVLFGGLCGIDSTLFTSVHLRGGGEGLTKGISFLKGTIQADKSVVWEDFTGDPKNGGNWFPAARSGKIWTDGSGKPAVHIATMGAGMWKRSLNDTAFSTAAFTTDISSGNLPLSVTFDASGSMPSADASEIVLYKWDFGDGNTATGEIVNHEFTMENTYVVQLTVTDNYGNKGTYHKNIEVFDYGPVADFIISTYSGKTNNEIQFYGELSYDESPNDSIISYEWNFKDRGTASGKNVSYTYTDWGRYNVTLTVRSSSGKSASVSNWITIELNTGSDITENDQMLKVFPNPVNDVLSITFFEQFSLKVFNSVGQIIYTGNNIFEGVDIDTQTWESGLYIIAIMKNNKTEFRKIIKK